MKATCLVLVHRTEALGFLGNIKDCFPHMLWLFYIFVINNNMYNDNANLTIYTISLIISCRYCVNVVIML